MATEKRLIEIDALIGNIDWDNDLQKWVLRSEPEDIPSVDAVEVVRCEKCLFRSQHSDENGCYKCGGLQTEDGDLVMMVKPDFYCAYGERRPNVN